MNNMEIINIKNTKKYVMPQDCCAKSVPGLTNISKNTKKLSPPVTFILLQGIGQALSSILSPNGAYVLSVLIQ